MNKVLFLPTNYQAPKSSNYYMKFTDGENKFRILSQPVLGWEDWLDKKPLRYRMDQKPAKSIDPKKPIKHFWAMIVWNYQAEEIQVLHLTQATIRKTLEALCSDADWGAPYFYDLKVLKSGEGIDTEYSLNPLPHKPLSSHIRELFDQRRANLEALFSNDDPFSKEHAVFTQGIFSESDIGVSAAAGVNKISMEDAYDLDMILDECDANYRKWFFNYIQKQYSTKDICELPADIYVKMKEAAVKNMEANHAKQKQQEPDFMEGLAS